MSRFHKLFRLLEKELSYQEKILGLLSQERAAIVKLDQEQLESIRKNKVKLVVDAVELEKNRQELIQQMEQEDLALTEEEQPPLKFTEIINHCPESPLKGDLTRVGAELKTVTESLKKLNSENGDLIKRTMGLVATTIAIMQSSPEADLPTYSAKGKLTKGDGDPVFTAPRKTFSRSV